MSQKLLKLIQQILTKEEVGTLFLGKGDQVRQVFFSGEEVHLIDPGKEPRFVPAPQLFNPDYASTSVLAQLFAEVVSSPGSAGALLCRAGVLPETHLHQYRAMEMMEELLYLLGRSDEHFLFEAGNVPEAVLMPADEQGLLGIPVHPFAASLQMRIQEQHDIAQVLPRHDELPVLSERGIAAQNSDRHWLFAQVGCLVDGFRDVHRLAEDCVFYPHRTLQILAAAARQGWIKKTLFRELEAFDPENTSPEEAVTQIAVFEAAAEMAVDDLPIRRKLVALFQTCGRIEDAVVQLNLIGDAYLGRKDRKRALATYEKALELDPQSEVLRAKLYEFYVKDAERARENGDRKETRRFLEYARRFRPEELDIYRKIIATYADDEAAVAKETIRVLEHFRRSRMSEKALEFLSEVLAGFPNSDTLRRRHVNLLLDAGRVPEAVKELEALGAQLVERGEADQAQEIFKKIGRLCPDSEYASLARADASPETRRRRPSFAALFLATLFIGLGGYQHLIYEDLEKERERFGELIAKRIPEPGTKEAREQRQEVELFLARINQLRSSHPFTIWSPVIQQVAIAAENRLNYLDHRLRRQLEQILAEGHRLKVLGKFDDSIQTYEALLDKGPGTPWAQEAKFRIEEIGAYRSESHKLYERALAAERDENYRTAFDMYRELLIDFPRSEVSKEVRLPVEVVTEELGLVVRSQGSILGRTPLKLKIQPWTALPIEIIGSDGKVTQYTIETPLEYQIPITLGADNNSGDDGEHR